MKLKTTLLSGFLTTEGECWMKTFLKFLRDTIVEPVLVKLKEPAWVLLSQRRLFCFMAAR